MSIYGRQRTIGTVWYSKILHKGRWYYRTLGPISRREARARDREFKVQLHRGEWSPEGRATAPTLDEAAQPFLDWYAIDRRRSSVNRRARSLTDHLLPCLGHVRVDACTPSLVDDYCVLRRREGASHRSINLELATLKLLLAYAGFPMKVRWLQEEEKDIPTLSPTQEALLLKAAPPRMVPLLRFALHTGLRKSELLTLTWAQVDWQAREGLITTVRSKNRRARRVPLNETALNVLRELNRCATTTDSVFRYKSIYRNMEVIQQRSGLKGVSMHTLRHAFASRLLQSGADINTVRELLGHQDVRMTQRYLHGSTMVRRAAVLLLDGHQSANSRASTP